MILYKRGEKYWNFEDDGVFYTPSKFTINTISNDFYIVYENNLKSKKYNISEVTLTDIVGGGSFTFANINSFMQKLEDLNCPCFQKDETIVNNPPFNPTNFLSSNIANYPNANLPIADATPLLVNENGVWKKVNKSEISKTSPIFSNTTVFHNNLPTNLPVLAHTLTIPANTFKTGDVWELEVNAKSFWIGNCTVIACFNDDFGQENKYLMQVVQGANQKISNKNGLTFYENGTIKTNGNYYTPGLNNTPILNYGVENTIKIYIENGDNNEAVIYFSIFKKIN